jgi:hypothetical protein
MTQKPNEKRRKLGYDWAMLCLMSKTRTVKQILDYIFDDYKDDFDYGMRDACRDFNAIKEKETEK